MSLRHRFGSPVGPILLIIALTAAGCLGAAPADPAGPAKTEDAKATATRAEGNACPPAASLNWTGCDKSQTAAAVKLSACSRHLVAAEAEPERVRRLLPSGYKPLPFQYVKVNDVFLPPTATILVTVFDCAASQIGDGPDLGRFKAFFVAPAVEPPQAAIGSPGTSGLSDLYMSEVGISKKTNGAVADYLSSLGFSILDAEISVESHGAGMQAHSGLISTNGSPRYRFADVTAESVVVLDPWEARLHRNLPTGEHQWLDAEDSGGRVSDQACPVQFLAGPLIDVAPASTGVCYPVTPMDLVVLKPQRALPDSAGTP